MTNKTYTQQNILEFLKAIASETRQIILVEVMSDKMEHSVGEISQRIHLGQSTTSEHLSILKRAGILSSKKVGKEVYYTLEKQNIADYLDFIKEYLFCC